MSKATLEFTIPEEQYEHTAACHGLFLTSVLHDFDIWLRNEAKYNNRESIPVDEIRSTLRELLDGAAEFVFNQ